MPVDGADIVKAQLFEPGPAHEHAARIFFGFAGGAFDRARRAGNGGFRRAAQRLIAAAADRAGEQMAHRADGRGDGHVIVIENHDLARIRCARIIHRFISHACRDGAVANDGDDVVVAPVQIACGGKACACGNRSRAMRRAERVIFALGAFRETGQPAAFAQACEYGRGGPSELYADNIDGRHPR